MAQKHVGECGAQLPSSHCRPQRSTGSTPYASPAFATEIRARVGERLARLCPGDLDTFLFTLGGADANENAIRIARAVTGRHKILSRYRSYHGATAGALQLTGDPRRWPGEPGPSGFIKVLDPKPYRFRFAEHPEAITGAHLRYLEDVIEAEGLNKSRFRYGNCHRN